MDLGWHLRFVLVVLLAMLAINAGILMYLGASDRLGIVNISTGVAVGAILLGATLWGPLIFGHAWRVENEEDLRSTPGTANFDNQRRGLLLIGCGVVWLAVVVALDQVFLVG